VSRQISGEVQELMAKYLAVMNSRLKKQRLPPVRQGQVLAAIATRFFLAHRSEIEESYDAFEARRSLSKLARVFGPSSIDILEATGTPLPPEVSDDCRAGGSGKGR
jgi:hypothetical protein